MVKLKTTEQIELIRESALIVSRTLGMNAGEIRPGITTIELDKMAEIFIRDHNAEPGFLGLYGFPNTLCVSPNEEIVHGIPSNIPLNDGDILSVDCGVLKNGFYGDHAYTFEVGEVPQETKKLLEVTKKSLYIGISNFKLGNRVGDLGFSIQKYTEKNGYGVVRELVGHGLGEKMHEDPEIPNYGKPGTGKKFQNGMVIAIEPMINQGSKEIQKLNDGWTIIAKDKKPSAHFEHNVALINGKPQLLSTFKYIYETIGIESQEEKPFTIN